MSDEAFYLRNQPSQNFVLRGVLEESLIPQLEKDMRPRAPFQNVGRTSHFLAMPATSLTTLEFNQLWQPYPIASKVTGVTSNCTLYYVRF
jgi:hypothetical protein